MADDTSAGWGRDAKRDLAALKQLDVRDLFAVLVIACKEVVRASELDAPAGRYAPAFVDAAKKTIAISVLLGEACAAEEKPKVWQ
jgi:hypothetical protein